MSVDALIRIAREQLGLRIDDRERVERIDQRMPDLAARGDAAQVLANELTTGETYFFRHAEQHAAFVEIVRPGARILSAGCSSGEEPYTLAMLCAERGVPVDISAFDVSSAAIARARRGEYSRWSLRTTPVEQQQRWFTDVRIDAKIRASVRFATANLLDYAWQRYDVIFCRNVLMYLTPEALEQALANISGALVPGGHLFVGHAESLDRRDGYELCHTHDAFYYRRSGAPAHVAPGWFDAIGASTARTHALLDAVMAPAPTATVLDEIRALIAEERFTEALDRLGPDGDPMLRALVLVHVGRVDAAEAACRALGETALAHYLIATCREGAGDLAGAIGEARRATAIDPDFTFAQLRLGLLARRSGDRVAARVALGRALELLAGEDAARLALLGGGFGRRALEDLCRSELGALA